MILRSDVALTYDDVYLIPNKSEIPSRDLPDTSIKIGQLELKVPIISANMDTVTGVEMAITMYQLGAIGALHRFWTIEENKAAYRKIRAAAADCFVSVGTKDGEYFRALELYNLGARHFIIDVAHGHSVGVENMLRKLRDIFSDEVYIVAGNVATGEAVEDLKLWGASAVKIGIGNGSICSTRLTTGFGVPSFSALLDCCYVADHLEMLTIADGGMRTSGDIAKSFVAGADAVMLGSLLAGTDETPGYEIWNHTTLSKEYRGMASQEVQDKIGNGDRVAPEGVTKIIPCKGPISSVIKRLTAGLRTAMSYGNCMTLVEMQQKVEWGTQTSAGFIEGTPHIMNSRR